MRDVQKTATPDTSDFRELMGLFPTGVCIVALDGEEHGIVAMTINSFVSVSLEPLLISWSVENRSERCDYFTKAERFTISLLADDQEDHAQRYAAPGQDQMRVADFFRSRNGLPVIDGALGHFECRTWGTYPAGDHTMILGEVIGLHREAGENARALGFFGGEFCSIAGDKVSD